jgi:signal transduction histidine kinase
VRPAIDLTDAVEGDARRTLGGILAATTVAMIAEGTSHLVVGTGGPAYVGVPFAFALLHGLLFLVRERLGALGGAAWWMLLPWVATEVSTLMHAGSVAPSSALMFQGALLIAVSALAVHPVVWALSFTGSTVVLTGIVWHQGDPLALTIVLVVALMAFLVHRVRYTALRDAERRRLLERALRQRDGEVARLRGLADMAAGVAHHVHNQLVGIVGGAGLLAESLAEDHPGRVELTTIEQSAARISELARGLATYTGGSAEAERADVPEPRPLEALVDLKDLARLVPEGIRWSVSIAPDLPPLRLPPDALDAALRELVRNAVEACADAAGERRIDLDVRHGDDGHVVLSVVDTGGGFDPALTRRLTDPFFSTREPTRPGLGLSRALGVALRLGGHLSADNVDGGGARFTLRVPVTPPEAHGAPD